MENSEKVYITKQDGESNEGLKFKDGDKFKVLESDGAAILIELIGNANNPYFVEVELLRVISDYE